ncbi:MAG: serine/threonine-protein kinase [Rothia sp. (in: high G+C Gram-positive bacteria)]|nr:serine/threonine-protein kinase [Rothia sp. (in: high G+C Gram-positive bacteria)]
MSQLSPGAPLGASYRLVDLVGKGASGQVWRLRHAHSETSLAAKILHSQLADDPAIVERFVRERSVLLNLKNEKIVTVRDMVVEGGTLALVMDYYAGGSLRGLLTQQKTLKPSQALRLVSAVLETLAYAHDQGVIHRDIKPDNILLDSDASQGELADRIRITDFGIASIVASSGSSHTTGLVGTPLYIPPESLTVGVQGAAGDVYSSGVMLYELLAGRTPFAGSGTDFAVAYRHVTSEVPELDLPQPLMQAINSLLQKNPQQRPQPLEAAATLTALAQRFDALNALPAVEAPQHFADVAQPKTVIRGSRPESEERPLAYNPLEDSAAPELGEAGMATVIRPQHHRQVTEVPDPLPHSVEGSDDKGPGKKKAVVLGILALVLLLASGWGVYWAVTSTSKTPFSAQGQQERALPTGLAVYRSASYDPATEVVTLTSKYSAQKAPLSGDLLVVVPALEDGGTCPNVTSEGGSIQRNQPLITGMDIKCGWYFADVVVDANREITLESKVTLGVKDQKQLEGWLGRVADETQQAIESEDYKSTSYPVQRLQNIKVKVPAHTVGQSVLPITLLPVWPSGEDQLNPLYSSGAIGEPSELLQSVAGSRSPVRFSDGCGGHLMVDTSGVKVTALSAAEQCMVNAQVGNFTDLKSDPFSITTRK